MNIFTGFFGTNLDFLMDSLFFQLRTAGWGPFLP